MANEWRDFVSAVVQSEFEFPHLKIAIIAQAFLECGQGSTRLFIDFCNPFGMHYHDFLHDLADSVDYAAHDGVAKYCKFHSFASAIKAYWRWFDHWKHYGDWRIAARKTALDFLNHIGPFYCPPGYSQKWKDAHSGLSYSEYIVEKIYARAQKDYEQFAGKVLTDADASTLTLLNRGENIGVVITTDDNKVIDEWEGTQWPVLRQWLTRFPNLAKISTKQIPWPRIEPKPKTPKLIYVEPGHSKSRPGANSLDPKTNEYELNELAANIIIKAIEAAGHKIKTVNPDPDNLQTVGKAAAGCDAAFSIHHNADSHKDYYTRCYLASNPNQESLDLSNKITAAISQELKLMDNGYEKSGLTVPNLFGKHCSGPSMLIELYFVDAYDSRALMLDRTTRAAKAVAQQIIAWADA